MDWSAADCCLIAMGVVLTTQLAIHLYRCMVFAFRCHFYRWMFKLDLASKYGSWAAVTGATSGIGFGLVKSLAEERINLILISRSQEKLQGLASDLREQYGIKTKILVSEATDRRSYKSLVEQLSQFDIGILVNNVGIIANEGRGLLRFHESNIAKVSDLVTVNCGAATLLMKGLLGGMIKRGRGLVINMSSIAIITPVPYQAQYSATKIYLDTLTEAMKVEMKESGVVIKSIRPFMVKSKMTATNNYAYNSPLAQTPEQFAKHMLPTLANDLSTCGYWLADLTIWSFRVAPQWYKTMLMNFMTGLAAKLGTTVPLN